MSKSTTFEKLRLVLFSMCISILLFITLGGEYLTNEAKTNESKLVIDDMNIEFIYDKDAYEIVDTLNSPYAVIKGDTDKLNLLKTKKNYKFYVDLTNYVPGSYNVKITYEGIPQGLSVDIYPLVFEVIISEKQTIEYEPTIEIIGAENVQNNLIVGVPTIISDIKTIRVRDTSEILNSIKNVKAIIDVSNYNKTKTVEAKIKLYDAEGNEIKNAGIIDETIKVNVPITSKVENVIIQDNNQDIIKELETKIADIEKDRNNRQSEITELEKQLKLELEKNKNKKPSNSNNSSPNTSIKPPVQQPTVPNKPTIPTPNPPTEVPKDNTNGEDTPNEVPSDEEDNLSNPTDSKE